MIVAILLIHLAIAPFVCSFYLFPDQGELNKKKYLIEQEALLQ
ncbi:hypothetical protein SD77_1209 [Bacillus badius]|uniref:Uncharacterized protein n=1 Tax=Bacillus badius TaxID=1455 RepID=A0ABR5AT74_BACBA|nr:hypothetical protein SD77_1209 [Bacillus badius]